jgi:hypothetical protein
VVGVDGAGVRLREEPRKRLRRRSPAHDESAADLLERRFQIFEALAQESEARRTHVRVARVVIVEDEDRDDAVRIAGGRGQRRVVVEAEVATEPVEDRHDVRESLPKISPIAVRRYSKIASSCERTRRAWTSRPRAPKGIS